MSTFRTLSLDGHDWTVYWLLPHEWLWRKVWEQDPPEAASRRLPATVPGHAQDALLQAGELPPPYQGTNSRLWEWASERDWVFEKRFPVPADLADTVLHLRFEGLDGSAHVYLNGRHVGDHEGQFVPAEWDVTQLVRPGEENHLLVVVESRDNSQFPIPNSQSATHNPQSAQSAIEPIRNRTNPQSNQSAIRNPQSAIGSASLVATGPAWFRSVAVYTAVAIDRTEASLSIVSEFDAVRESPVLIVAEVMQEGLPVTSVEDPLTVFRGDTSVVQSARIPRVQLWWPNGAGRQPLYTLRISLLDDDDRLLDQREIPFGIRQVDAVPCEGAPPDSLPYGLEVNGRRVWIKGWNWVPLDHLYGSLTPERYDRFLRLARDAGVNMLRVWGGGLLEKEAFYRLCDRYGIMVWQEFPLSSSGIDNTPPADAAYLEYIREQAEAMLSRRRNHPSLVLWCGGNELTGPELQPLGSDHPALAELREAVQTEDPQRLWLPTSPTGPRFGADPEHAGELHDVHGPWLWLGLREHPEFYNRIDPLLHSEFGCEGPANRETLEYIFNGPPTPPEKTDPVWMHHGGAWWLRPEAVEAAFGPLPDVDVFLRAGQMLQAMGLQYAVEANRRRKWRCAGVLPWQFNESWPNAVCTSAVDYFARPKPAFCAVKRAYRPFHVSAAFPTFAWSGRERFEAEVWLHNSDEERALLNVVARVTDLNGRELYQENLAAEAPENSAAQVDSLSWRFPAEFAAPFLLFLEVIDEEGETLARNAYLHSRADDPPFAPFLAAPETTLQVAPLDGGLGVRNAGNSVALGVTITAEDLLIEDSHFPLAPGEARAIRLSGGEPGEVRITAWNARERTL